MVVRARARRQDIKLVRAAAKKAASARTKEAARQQKENQRSKTRRREKRGRLGKAEATCNDVLWQVYRVCTAHAH